MAEVKEEEVDLLFCLDATGSMRTFIEGVRDGIQETVGRVVHDHPDASINLGFVAYRDWSDEGKEHPRIQKFPFTQNVGEFQQFVSDIKATGGGDYPEDVLGGLWESANMNWTAPTRILFHIFDAPPHGRDKYHSCPGDLYPDGHPSDRPIEEIFRAFRDKNVDYRMMVQGRYPLDQMVDYFKAQKAAIGYEKFNECPSIKDVAKIMSFVGKTVSRAIRVSPRPFDRHHVRPDPVRRPMARASEYKVYCGIDFGTHGSAFATCTAADPIPRGGMWGGNGVAAKTPTNVLLDSKKKLVQGDEGFGLAALEKFLELDDDERSSYNFFRRFKMELYKDEVKSDDRKEVDISEFLTPEDKDRNKKVRSRTVLVQALKFIIERVMEKIRTEYQADGEEITKEDVQWILTVPAIWSQKSRKVMESVAFKAGIPQTAKHDQLIVALEPECACVAAQKEMRLSSGNCYMMIDCGGGTVDIACHEMVSNTSVREIHPPSGGPWGSTYIDDVFWQEYLPHLFGRNVMNRVTQAEQEAVIHNFVTSKATATPTESTRRVRIDALMGAIKEEYGSYEAVVAHLAEVQFPPDSGENCGARLSKYGNLTIDRRIWDYMFDSVISKLTDHVKDLLEKEHLRDRIQTLCIVGGFSMSAILRDRLSAAFSERRIFRPSNPMLAVVTGAAMFGLSPSIIEERCAPKTLGVAVRDLWREGDSEERKQEVRGEGYVVDGVFFPFVRAGQPVPRGGDYARVVHSFEPVNHREFVVEIYQSNDPNPRFVPEEPCGRIGPIRFPDDFDHNADGISVEFDFSETLVQVRVWFGEHEAEGTAIEFFEDS